MQILTRQGYKDIQDCSIGEEVLYYDLVTGEEKYNTIKDIEKMMPHKAFPDYTDEEGNEVHINKKYYTVNGQYTFYSTQNVWANLVCKHAEDLVVGDVLYSDSDEDIVVESIESFDDEEGIFWKMTISGDHSFIADGITLHNSTFYWFGGTGNWSQYSSHWSYNSGNSPANAASAVPATTDDVVFNNLSSASNAAYSVSMDTGSLKNCANFTMNGPGSTNKVTWAGSSGLNVYGNWYTAGNTEVSITQSYNLVFKATSGTKTITHNGTINSSFIQFNGSGGTFQLADDLVVTQAPTCTAGTIDWNSHAVVVVGSAMTLSTTIGTYYSIVFRPTTPDRASSLKFARPTTITNAFVIDNGATITNRCLVSSFVIGIQRVLTVGSVTANNADFRDIRFDTLQDLSAITGGSGDCGGNNNIIFTTAVDQHWTNTGGGYWSTNTNWTFRVPLPQDDVYMDCAFGSGSRYVYADMARLGKNVNWTGATWGTALYFQNTVANEIYGSLILIPGITQTGGNGLYFYGRGDTVLDSAGVTFLINISIDIAVGNTLTLNHDFTSTGTVTIYSGTFSAVDGANNYDTTISRMVILGAGTLTLGSGLHICTSVGGGCAFDNNGAGTITAFIGTIKITDSSGTALIFAGGGKSYNRVWFDRGTSTANITISGSNTFYEIKDTGTDAHSLLTTAGTTQHFTLFTVSGVDATHRIILNSTSTAKYYFIKDGDGQVSCDFLDIRHCQATPANTWYAGANSLNGQATSVAGSGWIFTVPPITTPQTIDAVANIVITTQKTITGLARSQIPNVQKTITGISRISQTNIAKTISGVSRITINTQKTQTGVSKLATTTVRTLTGISRVTKTAILKKQTGLASIAIITVRTQLGKSAIQKLVQRTQVGLGRITKANVLQTIAGLSRITNANIARTISGISRLTKNTLKNQTGISKISMTTIRTIAGLSRLTKIVQKNQTGISKLAMTTIRTITSISRITTANILKTISGVSRITINTTKNLSGLGRIAINTQRNLAGLARITINTLKTITGVSKITATTQKFQTAKSAIQNTTARIISGLSKITATTTRTISGLSKITATTTKNQSGLASIQNTLTKIIAGLSRVTLNAQKTITGKSAIKIIGVLQNQTAIARVTASNILKTIGGLAKITVTTLQTQTGKSAIRKTATKTIDGLSKITATTVRTQEGLARITQANNQKTIAGTTRVTASTNRNQAGVANIVLTTTKTQTGVSRITKPGVSKTMPGIARITLSAIQKTITGLAKLATTTTKTITGLSRITKASVQRTQAGLAKLATTTTKTIAGISRVTQTAIQKNQSGIARVTVTLQKTITSLSRITKAYVLQTITSISRITKASVQQTISGLAKISITTQRTITGVSRVTISAVQQTISGLAKLAGTTYKNQDGLGRIIITAGQRNQNGIAKIAIRTVQTISSLARVTIAGVTKYQISIARITKANVQKTISSISRIYQASVQRSITGVATIIPKPIQYGKKTILTTGGDRAVLLIKDERTVMNTKNNDRIIL